MEQREMTRDKALEMFRLMDDYFMRLVFGGDNEATECLLRVIMEVSKLTVTSVVSQLEVINANGRSARFDIHAVDGNGKNFDVEIQRSDFGAGAERARFNSSLLDTKLAKVGSKIPKLNPAYVIFITESDVLGDGIPIYHIDRTIRELGNRDFGDGSHIIYVNGAYTDVSTPIGRLMHDFNCTSASDMYYGVLANRVHYLKETEGGYKSVCKIMEEYEKESNIFFLIKYCRLDGKSDAKIIEELQRVFDLSRVAAEDYLSKSQVDMVG